VSENGWTDDHLCREWFVKVFIPWFIRHNIDNDPGLVVWDGHRSHETLPLIEIAIKENIHLFSLPSHTSHHTQPLDVGVFGPTERYWGQKCDELADIGLQVTKDNIIEVYLEVREKAMTATNILSAF
jgi:hypothetical protein